MLCPKCRNEIQENSKFCNVCGKKVNQSNNWLKIIILIFLITIFCTISIFLSNLFLNKDNKNHKNSKNKENAEITTSSIQETSTEETTTEQETTIEEDIESQEFIDNYFKNMVDMVRDGFDNGITYDNLARTPDDYLLKYVTFSGVILQVIEEGDYSGYRVAIDDDYDKIVLIIIPNKLLEERLLENDNIKFYGYSSGLYSYESTLSSVVTIPSITCSIIDRE